MEEEMLSKAQVLIEALPYIQKFNGKIVVVKYGGSAMLDEELQKNVIKDVLNDEKNVLILIRSVIKGFATKSNTYTTGSFKIGMSAIIELIKPIKLNIPIKGTTAIFANTEKGAKLLK